MTYKIALAQTSADHQIEKNLSLALTQVQEAARNGAKLIGFPESFLFLGQSEAEYLGVAQSMDGPLITNFRETANRHKISILIGGFCEKNSADPTKTFNTSVLIDASGNILASYRKIHLFDVQLGELNLCESKTVSPGDQLVTCDHELGRLGLTICYDLRFPNQFQKLREMGAQVIFVPAAFTAQTGRYHWETLLRARAIENQVYICAPAQTGRHNPKRESFGHSLLIDPWGKVLVDGGLPIGLSYGEIDMNYLAKVRVQMPVFTHQVKGIDKG